jgi:hypothetical protein
MRSFIVGTVIVLCGAGAGILFGMSWIGWTITLISAGIWGLFCSIEEERQQVSTT